MKRSGWTLSNEITVSVFKQFNSMSIIAVYLLILAGGIVRSTGSGMGCPDWPTCFGSYVPPISIESLPDNYKDIYSRKRAEKNARVARIMGALGMRALADKITKDKSILEEQTFNPVKTWIEYINRIIGLLLGFFILAAFINSFQYKKGNRKLVILSLMSLLLVIFQGWIGSVVVSTNLLPGMITFHMLLAIGLIAILLYISFEMKEDKKVLKEKKSNRVSTWLAGCLLLLAQIVLGTQVREAVDTLAVRLGEAARGEWIENLGLTFLVHRSYSLLLLVLHIWLVVKLFRSYQLEGMGKGLAWGLVLLIGAEIVTGAVLSYFALPFLVQPLHLFLALVIFGIQYYLWMMLRYTQKKKIELANA